MPKLLMLRPSIHAQIQLCALLCFTKTHRRDKPGDVDLRATKFDRPSGLRCDGATWASEPVKPEVPRERWAGRLSLLHGGATGRIRFESHGSRIDAPVVARDSRSWWAFWASFSGYFWL